MANIFLMKLIVPCVAPCLRLDDRTLFYFLSLSMCGAIILILPVCFAGYWREGRGLQVAACAVCGCHHAPVLLPAWLDSIV